MAWSWRYEKADGTATGESRPFDSQSDAETWIGQEFETLAESGVDQVTLLDDGTVVYGPMGLLPD